MFAGRFVARLGTDIDVGTTFVHNTVRACACRHIRFGSKKRKTKSSSLQTPFFCGVGFRWGGVRACAHAHVPNVPASRRPLILVLAHVCACARCSGVSAARRSSCPQPPRHALPGHAASHASTPGPGPMCVYVRVCVGMLLSRLLYISACSGQKT